MIQRFKEASCRIPCLGLDRIARTFSTDKSSLYHGYTKYYEQHFARLRWQKLSLLEIGIFNGASLKVWDAYFPFGNIHGLDINPDCKAYATKRIKVHIGDQADETFLKAVCDSTSGFFDIIIDDGSHINDLTLASFNYLFQFVAPGGYYVIEDLHCSYENDHHFSNKRDGVRTLFTELIEAVDLNCRPEVMESVGWGQNFDRVSDEVKDSLSMYERWVESLHFYQSMIFIRKRAS